MSNMLFPSIQPEATNKSSVGELYKEVKWDYDKNVPVFKNGTPVIVVGKDAVLVWAWKAINTPRFKHEIYTWDYGNEAESLIGRTFTEKLKQSEAVRYIKECLLINPYISDVVDVSVAFFDGSLRISCTIKTVYGEASINV